MNAIAHQVEQMINASTQKRSAYGGSTDLDKVESLIISGQMSRREIVDRIGEGLTLNRVAKIAARLRRKGVYVPDRTPKTPPDIEREVVRLLSEGEMTHIGIVRHLLRTFGYEMAESTVRRIKKSMRSNN